MLLTSERDEAILKALTWKVTVLRADQIASAWWPSTPSGRRLARKRLRRLEGAGLLHRDEVLVEPLLPLEEPVRRWRPGEPAPPSYDAIAHHLEARWTKPPRTAVVYTASRRSANHYGGFGGPLKDRFHATHDVHVGELYLRLLRRSSEQAEAWLSEESLKRPGQVGFVPDAMLRDVGGRDVLAIEFAGVYPPSRLQQIHEDCSRRALPYEIW